MIRRTALKRSTKPIPKRRAKPRVNLVRDPKFLKWVHANFGCLVASAGGCSGRLTWHHIRDHGALGKDSWGLLICEGHHQHDAGTESLERLGREKWQARFGVSIKVEAFRYRLLYVAAGFKLKGADD